MASARAGTLQVSLELVVDERPEGGVPRDTEPEAMERTVVGVGEVVALARQTEIERSSAASDDRSRASVGGCDQPNVATPLP
jgi:hypothetical protein